MIIRTPTDLGAIIKDRRKKLGLDQAALAKAIGVSRQWVVAIERGRSGAELGLVLRALDSLGIRLSTKVSDTLSVVASPVDLNAIVASARKSKR